MLCYMLYVICYSLNLSFSSKLTSNADFTFIGTDNLDWQVNKHIDEHFSLTIPLKPLSTWDLGLHFRRSCL